MEYALAAGMVAVAAVALIPAFTTTVSKVFTSMAGSFRRICHECAMGAGAVPGRPNTRKSRLASL
jgi:hypothetical protein